jgi:signal peptidase
MRAWRRVAREILLTTAAAIGVVCAVAALAAVLFDIRPLIFRSGSMAPEVPVGSLALARSTPAEDVVVGDVISVFRADGLRVTHGVIAAEPAGSAVRFTLQGDANADPDAVPYVAGEVDRVFWSQPGWGRVVREAQSTPVVFAAGVVVGAVLVTSLRRPARVGPA